MQSDNRIVVTIKHYGLCKFQYLKGAVNILNKDLHVSIYVLCEGAC